MLVIRVAKPAREVGMLVIRASSKSVFYGLNFFLICDILSKEYKGWELKG